MADASKEAELNRLTAELDGMRATVKIARDAHTRDAERLDRLERSISLVEREIAKALQEAGAD
jgi:outer membrane murein-binding lipoprotein Lpp